VNVERGKGDDGQEGLLLAEGEVEGETVGGLVADGDGAAVQDDGVLDDG